MPPPRRSSSRAKPELSTNEAKMLLALARRVKAGELSEVRIELHRQRGTLRLHECKAYDCAA